MSDAAVQAERGPRARRHFPMLFKKNSRPQSSFSHSQILPHNTDKLDYQSAPFGAPPALPVSPRHGSVSPESVFSGQEVPQDQYHEPRIYNNGQPTSQRSLHHQVANNDEPGSYDLKPPPPSVSHSNVEALALRFFSADHLNLILHDHTLARRFSNFLSQYKPACLPLLSEYIETQKVVSAVEYANAVANQTQSAQGQAPYLAATLDEQFEARAQETVDELVTDALPAYATSRLVQLVTESLVKEITGHNTPLMREMIPSLAEVYCVTDPSLPDNPIVYASDEFYNTSQYGKEYVIGRNCRFLQGPKTADSSVKRLIDALAAGQEVSETILNYRRDGTPFMNLLMIAPLYDNKGTVRYFLGCQIDVSPLIEAGRGLESFEMLLSRDRTDSRFGGRTDRKPAEVLGELGAMLNEEENKVMKQHALRYSEDVGRATPPSTKSGKGGRRILGMDDEASARNLWPHPSLGPSGRLPGVYQNYLLVRPYPSLRITFTSPALRIPGLLQTKFLERVGGPSHVREGILDALAHGTSVTAKISWLMHSSASDGVRGNMEGKPRWIHCTPLLGSDEKVGVWMIVMVEQEEVTGSLTRGASIADSSEVRSPGAASSRFTGSKLYTEYMRREGKSPPVNGSQHSRQSSTARDAAAAEENFKNF